MSVSGSICWAASERRSIVSTIGEPINDLFANYDKPEIVGTGQR